jgi:hypothetical protein
MMPIMEVTSSARKSVCREWIMGTPPHTAASKLKLRDRDGMGWRGCYRGERRRRNGEEIESNDGVQCAKVEWSQLRMDRR